MSIGILSWTNETGLSPYPLTKGFGYNSFLIDANFIQFDNFIPILHSIQVIDDEVIIRILLDNGVNEITLAKSFFSTSGVVHKIFDGDRYMGKLVFGADAGYLVESEIANLNTKTINIPFLSHLVKSIPSNAGVFSIDSVYGTLSFDSDEHIWYDTNSNEVTFNAISGLDYQDDLYLKTLNAVGPVSNSVYLKDSQVIKIKSVGNSAIEISLVGTDLDSVLKPQGPIITNG